MCQFGNILTHSFWPVVRRYWIIFSSAVYLENGLAFLWHALKTEGNPSDKEVLEASVLEHSILAGEKEKPVSGIVSTAANTEIHLPGPGDLDKTSFFGVCERILGRIAAG